MADLKVAVAITGTDALSGPVSQSLFAMERLKKSVSGLMDAMGSVGTKMTLGLTVPLLSGAAAATKIAFNATETRNLFDVSMKGMSESGKAWANTMHEALGLNESEVQRSLGTFQAMFNGMQFSERAAYDLSEGLTSLAYDLASFYNLTNDEAFMKIRSGIMGETEPLKELGIILNETSVANWAYTNGLAKQGAELSENQKILARYGLLMQSTKDAQGDLLRTQDSGSNQLRRMGSEFQTLTQIVGSEFEPGVASALNWINNEGFPAITAGLQTSKIEWGKMSVDSQGHLITLAEALLVGGPLMMGLSFAYKAVVGFREAWKVLRLSAVAEIAAIGAAVYGLVRAGMAFGMMKDEGLDVFTAWERAGSNVDQTIGGWIDGMKNMGDQFLVNTGLSLTLEDAMGTYNDILGENKAKTEESRQALQAQKDALLIAQGAWNQGGAAAASGGKKTADAANTIKKAVDAARSAIEDLSRTPLVGERAASDRAFQIEKGIKEMEVALANMDQTGAEAWNKEPSHPKDWATSHWDLENAIAGQKQFLERVNAEAWLQFEPAKHDIQGMLPYQELAPEQIKAGIIKQLEVMKQAEKGVIAANPQLAPLAGIASMATGTGENTVAGQQGDDMAKGMIKGVVDGLKVNEFGKQIMQVLSDQLAKVDIKFGPWRLTSEGFNLMLTITAPPSGGSGGSGSGGSSSEDTGDTGNPGVQSYAVGTNYVPYTGLAFLHKGKAVVPASQNRPASQSQAAAVEGNLVVQFNAPVTVRSDNDLVRIAKEVYAEFARNNSALNLARARGL